MRAKNFIYICCALIFIEALEAKSYWKAPKRKKYDTGRRVIPWPDWFDWFIWETPKLPSHRHNEHDVFSSVERTTQSSYRPEHEMNRDGSGGWKPLMFNYADRKNELTTKHSSGQDIDYDDDLYRKPTRTNGL